MEAVSKSELEQYISGSRSYFLAPTFVEDFLLLYYNPDQEISDLLTSFRSEHKGRFTKDSLEVTDRVLNHWESRGIIPGKRSIERGWRAYTFMDYVWINVITSLRKFGYSLTYIENVQKYLTQFTENVNSDYPMLMLYFAYAVSNKDIIYLLAFENGTCELATRTDYLMGLAEKKDLPNHIIIDISKIMEEVGDVFPKEFKYEAPNLPQLNSKESRLIEIFRLPDVDQIIVYKNSKPDERIEYKISKQGKHRKIYDELNSLDFGGIEINVAGKKVVRTVTTKSERLK